MLTNFSVILLKSIIINIEITASNPLNGQDSDRLLRISAKNIYGTWHSNYF